MDRFNTFKTNEKFEHNLQVIKDKGYTPKYKPGYFIVNFIDSDSRQNKLGIEYKSNIRFLKRFGDEIGAKPLEEDGKIVEDGNDYVIYVTNPGNEIECMKKAETFDFVLDTDLYDEKNYLINDLFQKIEDEILDNQYEFNMMSDGDLNKLLNRIEDIIKEIRNNI